jgi:autotransporter-associated beta strand protein
MLRSIPRVLPVAACLLALCSAGAVADMLVDDDFPYSNGPLVGNTPAVGGTWSTASGTAEQIQVVNNTILLSDAFSEDVQSAFGTSVTTGEIYFGFDISVADPGSYSGTDFEYFAHWTTSSSLQSRTDIAAFSASGWRPGIASTASTAEAVWATDLAYASDYRLVVGYDFTTGLSTLWVDPTASTDTSIISTTSVTGFTATAFGFRQSSASPDQALTISNLKAATTFAEVLLAPPPVTPTLDWYGDGVSPGGSGTWSAAGANWSDNGGAAAAWDPTYQAAFGGAAGTVTVDAAGVTAETGLEFQTTGYTVTGGDITLGTSTNAITVAEGATATVASVLAGTVAGVVKAGPGTLVLTGSNSFTGPVSVADGRLEVAADAALGAATNGLILTGGSFAPSGSLTLPASRAVSGAGGIEIASGTTLTVAGDFTASTALTGAGTLDLQGAVREVGALTFNAAGTLTAAGAITASGVTAATVTAGTATVTTALDLGTGAKTVGVGDGGTLDLQGAVTLAGTLTKEGAGTLVLGGTGSSIDRLQVGRGGFSFTDGGVIRAGEAADLGNNTIYYNYGTVELTAPVATTVGISFGGRAGTEAVIGGAGGNAALTVDGPIGFYGPAGSGDMVTTINNASTFNGAVTLATTGFVSGWTINGTGSLALTGDSAATLTAPVTLAGSTALDLTGSVGGNVTLGAATSLTGSGSIGGTVSGAGQLSPGASPGILTMAAIDPSAGLATTLEFTAAAPDYAAATASLNDVIRLTDATTPFATAFSAGNTIDVFFTVASLTTGDSFSGGFFTDLAADFTADVSAATFDYYVLGDGNGSDAVLAGQGYYSLASYDPAIAIAFSTTATTAGFASGSVSGQAGLFQAVPEPSGLLLASLAIGGAALARRRE